MYKGYVSKNEVTVDLTQVQVEVTWPRTIRVAIYKNPKKQYTIYDGLIKEIMGGIKSLQLDNYRY